MAAYRIRVRQRIQRKTARFWADSSDGICPITMLITRPICRRPCRLRRSCWRKPRVRRSPRCSIRACFSPVSSMRTFSTRKTSCRRGMSSGKALLLWKHCSNACRRALKRNSRSRRRKKKSKNGSCRSTKSVPRSSPRASPQEKKHEGIYTG